MKSQSVLTGDLVSSSNLGAEAIDKAMATLEHASVHTENWPIAQDQTLGNTHFTRFQGDGWQALVQASKLDMRVALFMFATLKAQPSLPETRIAVGQAEMENISGPNLSDAYGAAFQFSGRALSEMSRSERLRFDSQDLREQPILNTFLNFLDDRIRDWTPEQAEAVSLVISPDAKTQTTIASEMGISPQALSARLNGARWPTIRELLKQWEMSRPAARDKI